MSPYNAKPPGRPPAFTRIRSRERVAHEHRHAAAVYEDLPTTCFDCGRETTVRMIAPCVWCGRETCPDCRSPNPSAGRTCCAIERNQRQPKIAVYGE